WRPRAPLILLGSAHKILECALRDQEPRFLEFASRQPMISRRIVRARVHRWMIPKNGIMPSFNVQIRIVAGANECMHDLRPIRLTEPRHAMFRHAFMTNPVAFQEGAINVSVLAMHMKNARTEPVNRLHRIDELADQMAGVPFKPEVLVPRRIEEFFPKGRSAKGVRVHHRQMELALRT